MLLPQRGRAVIDQLIVIGRRQRGADRLLQAGQACPRRLVRGALLDRHGGPHFAHTAACRRQRAGSGLALGFAVGNRILGIDTVCSFLRTTTTCCAAPIRHIWVPPSKQPSGPALSVTGGVAEDGEAAAVGHDRAEQRPLRSPAGSFASRRCCCRRRVWRCRPRRSSVAARTVPPRRAAARPRPPRTKCPGAAGRASAAAPPRAQRQRPNTSSHRRAGHIGFASRLAGGAGLFNGGASRVRAAADSAIATRAAHRPDPFPRHSVECHALARR